MDRIDIARVYKIRSDESLAAAERCLEQKHCRASINRAWYSVMQMITAATYLILQNKKPPSDQPNWNHRLQGGLFQELASRRTGVPKELFWKYVQQIENLFRRREQADYRIEADDQMTADCAVECIEAAKSIRQKVTELVGEWP